MNNKVILALLLLLGACGAQTSNHLTDGVNASYLSTNNKYELRVWGLRYLVDGSGSSSCSFNGRRLENDPSVLEITNLGTGCPTQTDETFYCTYEKTETELTMSCPDIGFETRFFILKD